MTPDLKSEIQAAARKFVWDQLPAHKTTPISAEEAWIWCADFALSQVQHYVEQEKGTKMSETFVQFEMTADYCSWCERGDKPKHLDQDGVLISISGKPGYLCHAQDDFWWPCVPSIRREAQAEQKKRDAEKNKELIAAGEEVSTRWLENRLTKTEIGRLGRAIVAAIKGQLEDVDEAPDADE